MTFLFGQGLLEAIQRVARGKNPRFAVAFWGKGAPEALGLGTRPSKAICNLAMGGTNPNVIRAMDSASLSKLGSTKRIRQCDDLHAKVFLCDDLAVVGSANASANGLGFESIEASGWREAGILIDNAKQIEAISKWFQACWSDSSAISNDDIRRALLAWRARRAVKPPLVGLRNFDPDADDFPLLYPDYGHDEVELGLGVHQTESDLVDWGIEVKAPEDRKLLYPGRWVLWWKQTDSGMPHRRALPQWVQTGRFERQAWSEKGSKRQVPAVLKAATQGEPPFKITEIGSRIRALLAEDQFSGLRQEYEGSLLVPTLDLTRRFWRALKETAEHS